MSHPNTLNLDDSTFLPFGKELLKKYKDDKKTHTHKQPHIQSLISEFLDSCVMFRKKKKTNKKLNRLHLTNSRAFLKLTGKKK